ncbi:MAG: C1 family peptidase [Sphingomonadales bacterium]|nr:C1 family peptidase [Sphingomonadales bacterium]MDE2170682.1 C1 family peptidase [Sphingomonadales bacterium]
MATIEIEVDLRERFGPARDQGPRPTCLAFATSDNHAGLRAGWQPLSCEYLYFHAQRRAGRLPGQGAVLPAMLEALRGDGQPVEAGWPYLDASPPEGDAWKPPIEVGSCYGRVGVASQPDVSGVRSMLSLGHPIVVLSMLSRSFFRPVDGAVAPVPGEQPEPSQRHAVVAVGHGRVDGEPATLVRNSWGPGWGLDGHAWLTDAFLAPRIFATATLMEEVNVPSRAIAA